MSVKYPQRYIETYQAILAFCFTQYRTNADIAKHVDKSDANAYGFLEKLVKDGFVEKLPVKARGKLFLYKSHVSELPDEAAPKPLIRIDRAPFVIEGKHKWAGNPWREGIAV